MSQYTVQESSLVSVADAIRTKGGTSATLEFPTGFVTAIENISGGSGGTPRTSADLTVSGATVTAPAGTYASAASKSVASGTEGTPTATLGSVIDHAIQITPSVTNTAGYISGGTKTGTTVTIGVEDLVSGTYEITSSGIKDIPQYAAVSIASGSVTAPTSISGTSATISTGTNTLTLTKTVSVTPSVSTAGYISSGTAGDSSVSLTASVATKGATTYNTSSTDQTITSGTYLTGTQTIRGVTVSGLTAANVADGVTVKIGDSADDDRIVSVTGTLAFQNIYTGTSAPSSSLGNVGDIYIQTSS